jgi:hypothetical protein
MSEENFSLAERIESVPVHFEDKMYQYILSQNWHPPTTTAMAERAMVMAMAKVMAMMLPPPPMPTMSMATTAAIQGQRLNDGNWTTTMGQQQSALMMTVMMRMAETAIAMVMAMTIAMATATAMAMEMVTPMMPPPLTVKMSTKTMEVIQGWQLDVNDGTTLMYVNNGIDNSGGGDGNMKWMTTEMATVMMLPLPPSATLSMKRTAVLQGWRLGDGNSDNDNGTTMMGQQQCDGDGWPATCRTLASAAPPI